MTKPTNTATQPADTKVLRDQILERIEGFLDETMPPKEIAAWATDQLRCHTFTERQVLIATALRGLVSVTVPYEAVGRAGESDLRQLRAALRGEEWYTVKLKYDSEEDLREREPPSSFDPAVDPA